MADKLYTAKEIAHLREVAATATYLASLGYPIDYHEGKLAQSFCDAFGMDVPDALADNARYAAEIDRRDNARDAADWHAHTHAVTA